MNNSTAVEYHRRCSHSGNGQAKGLGSCREVVGNPKMKGRGHNRGSHRVANNNGEIYDGIRCR